MTGEFRQADQPFQRTGYDLAGLGNEIGLVDLAGCFNPAATAPAASVEKLHNRYNRVRSGEILAASAAPSLSMDSLSWYPEIEIVGTTVINNRARSLLLTSPHRTIVENCPFSGADEAILSVAGFGGLWFKSGHARDLTIRGNTFLDGDYGRTRRGGELIRLSAADSQG